MKNYLILFLLGCIAMSADATVDTLQTKSTISDVMVFFTGAQVTRKMPLVAMKGKHIVVIKNLPGDVKEQSLQVKNLPGVKLLSVKQELKYPEATNRMMKTPTEARVEEQKRYIKELKNRYKTFSQEEDLLEKNSKMNKKTMESSVAAIKEAADFYRSRLNEIKQSQLLLSAQLDSANNKLDELNKQLSQEQKDKYKVYSEVKIAVECEREIKDSLTISYFLPSAGWQPLYDFRVENTNSPLNIVYNANVFQSSGEDWDNVNLKLSTNNPSQSGSKPELEVWYAGSNDMNRAIKSEEKPGKISGRVLSAQDQDPLPGSNIVISQENKIIASRAADLDGQYTIYPLSPGIYQLKVMSVGMETYSSNVEITSGVDKRTDILMNGGTQLQDVIVSNKAADKSRHRYREIENSKTEEELNEVQSVASVQAGAGAASDYGTYYWTASSLNANAVKPEFFNSELHTVVNNLQYDIDIPYTIPSDGKEYQVKIQEVKVPVKYSYHVVPKIDNDAFLLAEITDWSQLHLLSGKAGIYYEGTFTGETDFDASQTGDTLTISLGREKSIVVNREGDKKINDKRFSGSTVKETVGWKITARNNRRDAVKLFIEDQYPLTQYKTISSELIDVGGAKVDDKTGKLVWEMELAPSENKSVNFSYSVKYPAR